MGLGYLLSCAVLGFTMVKAGLTFDMWEFWVVAFLFCRASYRAAGNEKGE